MQSVRKGTRPMTGNKDALGLFDLIINTIEHKHGALYKVEKWDKDIETIRAALSQKNIQQPVKMGTKPFTPGSKISNEKLGTPSKKPNGPPPPGGLSIALCERRRRLHLPAGNDAPTISEIRDIIAAAKTRSDAASRSDYTLLTEEETERLLALTQGIPADE